MSKMTMTEKILAKHAGLDSVKPGDNVWVNVDILLTHDVCGPGTIGIFHREFGADAKVFDKEGVVIIPDHYIFTADEKAHRNVDTLREFVKEQDLPYFYEPGTPRYCGVCHLGLPQHGHVRPGEVIVGTDSHTCSHGALGAFSTGIGNTDAGFVMGTGKMLVKVPETIRFVLNGKKPDYISAKDMILRIIGDIGVAVTFVFYAFAQNVYMTLVAECMLGIFMAMTNGVDQCFLKFNANKIDPSGDLFKSLKAKMQTIRNIAIFVVVFIGGIIAKFNLRLPIALSFIPYFIGGLIAFKIKDFDKKAQCKFKNPIKDMVMNIKEIIKTPKVKSYLCTYILGKELTHAQIWIFTPLLIVVGVPIQIVSLGWILNSIMQILGSKIAEKMTRLKVSTSFAIPLLIEIVWISILVINANIITVWLFALNGLVHGLANGILVTPLQQVTKDEIQTSVMSIASTGARLLYIPLVYFINYLGNIKLQWGLLGVLIVFVPIGLLLYRQLRKLESKTLE